MKRSPAQPFRFFSLISILEGIVVFLVLFSIPTDPKNSFFLGYSKSRLILLAVSLVLLLVFVVTLLHQRIRQPIIDWIAESRWLQGVTSWVGGVMLLLLWLTVWIPAYRLEELAATFTRLQPLLIWVELIAVQFSLLLWYLGGNTQFEVTLAELKQDRKWFYLGIGLFGITLLTFAALALLSRDFLGNQLYFPPGAPLSGLQVILSWVVFFLLFRLENRDGNHPSTCKVIVVLVFLCIWALTFVTWNSTPLTCTDDRPGPYPPNQVCYPNVNDAVYSIGSHYITLGQGVNNHWLTDKPLYMAFLALGQAVAGEGIEDYLTFQVAVIALIPALLYLAGRKTFGNAFGFFLALLMMVQGLYSITLYRAVGSVNVKLENPEVLTALVLLLFAFAAFKWLRDPSALKWAILSGGTLSLAVLLRYNPFFIAPLLLLVIVWVNGKHLKPVLSPLLLFMLAFALVFSPWFFSATDRQGRNHYVTKIEEVISSRFSNRQDTEIQVTPTVVPADSQTALEADGQPGILTYDLGTIDKAGLSGIFYHFLNNEFTGLAKLPTTFVLHPINEQVKGSIWDFATAEPVWAKALSPQNLVAMSLSLALVLLGVWTAWKRFEVAGLTGLVIQTGYYAGNAVAQTSGGRYIEPVYWVLLIYYCLGIYALTCLGVKVFSRKRSTLPEKERPPIQDIHQAVGKRCQSSKWTNPILLVACLLIGLILPALDLLPAALPDESDPGVEQAAFEILAKNNLVNSEQWISFMEDPNRVVVQGMAYHPRYYRSNFYRKGNLSFEVMLLAKDHVFVGYSPRMIPGEEFSDGSEVILIGCRLRRDSLWAAERVITESIAVIQLDHEGSLLFDEETSWDCSP